MLPETAFPDYNSYLGYLRDWFAGQVANGMAACSRTADASYGPAHIAVRSYEIADALITARQQSTKEQDHEVL